LRAALTAVPVVRRPLSWIRSITDNLLKQGVITEAELRAALDRV
jgi:hypothetical protein